ncbi:MAG: mechanosensitive ion channel family protein, partial [Candidatus Bathyarchaeia archaeon]
MNGLLEIWNRLLEILNIATVRSVIIAVVTVIGAIIVQRMLKKAIARFCEEAGLSEHVRGILTLISNVAVAASGIFIVLGVLGLPIEWFALTGTLTGTAIGFASTQTLGNFLAGLYILITSPFKVMDYIKIGDIEGEVRRITINYTRIFTPTYNLMEIPNREILNSRILNCTVGDQVDYTFTTGFDHKVGNKELVEK